MLNMLKIDLQTRLCLITIYWFLYGILCYLSMGHTQVHSLFLNLHRLSSLSVYILDLITVYLHNLISKLLINFNTN